VTDSTRISEISRRGVQYWGRDGLLELLLGSELLIGTIIFSFSGVFHRGSAAAQVYPLIAIPLWFGCSLVPLWAFKRLKANVTFPRGGYIAFPRESAKQQLVRVGVIALVAAAMVVVSNLPSLSELSSYRVPGCLLVFALGMLVSGLRYKLPHQVWAGSLSLLGGAWVYRNGTGVEHDLPAFAWLGGVTAVAGALRLWAFLRVRPASGGSEE
jgi:hypothetical protein